MHATDPAAISVVIPAYKAAFLAQALASLAAQTDPHFEVVVADDGSPEALAPICQRFAAQLNLRYLRFDDNLGQRSLTAHWTRAVDAAKNDWVWLMGDDDALQPGCIQALRQAVADDPAWTGLWRVDVAVIDAQGQLRRAARAYPPQLSAADYVRLRWQGAISSFACETLFRRSVLRLRGGFVDFPMAWCSDDATWVRLAGAAGMRTVQGADAQALWRESGQNISGQAGRHGPVMAQAMLRYMQWLHGDEARQALQLGTQAHRALLAEGREWFFRRLVNSGTRLSWLQRARCAQALGQAAGGSAWRALARMSLAQRAMPPRKASSLRRAHHQVQDAGPLSVL